jgi:predicted ester cyclase
MSEANKTLVARYYKEILEQGKLELIGEIFDPDFHSHLSNGTDLALESYTGFIGASFSALSDIEITIHDQIAESDKVATRWTAKGKLAKPFAGISEVGKTVEVSAIHIHGISKGKIVDHWEAINLHAIVVK